MKKIKTMQLNQINKIQKLLEKNFTVKEIIEITKLKKSQVYSVIKKFNFVIKYSSSCERKFNAKIGQELLAKYKAKEITLEQFARDLDLNQNTLYSKIKKIK